MRFAKPHFHLTSLIYIPVFLLSAYFVLFQSYWALKSITVVCFIWLIALALIAFSRFGNKVIGTATESTIVTEKNSILGRTIGFQLLVFITLLGGLFAIHSFISPQIILFPRVYAFFIFFSWVIYLLFAAAFACFERTEKLSFINQCLSPLLQLSFFKKHETTFKVVNNTYFFQANFIWFSATIAILLFAITRLVGILLHCHLVSDFTLRNILIASILFMLLSTKGWKNFIRENAYKKQFFVLFLSVSILLIVLTNALSWLFYYIGYLFSYSQLTFSISIQHWFNWINSIALNQILIWFWLLGFIPFVALKTVQIYQGFSIKKMIGYNLIIPTAISLMLLFFSSFTVMAANLPKQIFALTMILCCFGLMLFAFLTQPSFQKIFFSKATAIDSEAFHNVIQATRGIFQNIIALFILMLLCGLLIVSFIIPIIFLPIWLLTILLCISVIYAIRQSQFAH